MAADRTHADPQRPAWIFGYGSLIWRPAFEHEAREPALLAGFCRRFWQGSVDHRGTPDAPGRVVTLVAGGQCAGVAYRVRDDALAAVLEALDRREQGGYRRVHVRIRLRGAAADASAVTYIAEPGNPNYLGPASLLEIADTVRRCHGPSGANLEYVARLHAALAELGAEDDHVDELMRLVSGARLSA